MKYQVLKKTFSTSVEGISKVSVTLLKQVESHSENIIVPVYSHPKLNALHAPSGSPSAISAI